MPISHSYTHLFLTPKPYQTSSYIFQHKTKTNSLHTDSLHFSLYQPKQDKTILLFITNKAYTTTFRSTTYTQRQFVHNEASFHRSSLILYALNVAIPNHTQPITYADDCNIHTTKTSSQTFMHNSHAWTKSDNPIPNSDKTTCIIFFLILKNIIFYIRKI